MRRRHHHHVSRFLLFHGQLLQQASSISNQGSFNGLQRLGGELILSHVFIFTFSLLQFLFFSVLL